MMDCPHCKKKIDMSAKLWMIWYREDIRNRIITQTGNPSLTGLVDLAVNNVYQGVEQFIGSMCLAWDRGRLKGKEESNAT